MNNQPIPRREVGAPTDTGRVGVEQKVMGDIKSGKVQLRSKYIFLAEKLGVGSAIILTALLAVLFFNLFLFYLKTSDNLAYLSFGQVGIFAFLESFPYLLVSNFILLIFVAGYFLKKSAFAYKKPFGIVALVLVVLVLAAGGGLAFSKLGFNERVEREAFGPNPHMSFMRNFMSGGMDEMGRGIVGRVALIKNDHMIVQTPRSLETIYYAGLSAEKVRTTQVGDVAVFVGERKDGDFYAQDIRLLKKDDMPMIRRNILRRHGERRTNNHFSIPKSPHF